MIDVFRKNLIHVFGEEVGKVKQQLSAGVLSILSAHLFSGVEEDLNIQKIIKS